MTAAEQPGGQQHTGITPCCGKRLSVWWMTCGEFQARANVWFGSPWDEPWEVYDSDPPCPTERLTPGAVALFRRRQVNSLEYRKKHGFRFGERDNGLRDLAAAYARKMSVEDLADALREVIAASDQDSQRFNASYIAARAKRFTDRSDLAQEQRDKEFWNSPWMQSFLRWALAENASVASAPSQIRHPGIRKPGSRTPG